MRQSPIQIFSFWRWSQAISHCSVCGLLHRKVWSHAMATVVIHHCKLRIVRRHGWAWGAEPQRLLQSAVHILPELLARQLAGLWDDEVQSDITVPVCLTIPVRLSDLLAAHEAHTDPDLALDATPLPALHTRLVHTLRRAFLEDHPLPAEPA